MFDTFLDKVKALFSSRLVPLGMIFLVLFVILIHQVFQMQIVEGSTAADRDEYKNTEERDIASTRGLIYDKNGYLLAYNELKYAVVMSDTGLLTTNTDKNAMLYRLIKLLEQYGNELELDFGIYIDENGQLAFNVSGNAELRFKKNAYCLTSVNKLSEQQRNASAQEVFDFLRYGDSSVTMFQISNSYSLEDALKIMTIRYTMQIQPAEMKYTQFTLASNVTPETAAAVKENIADLPGVEVQQQTYRVYNDAKYFAHIIGYTGLINSTELESLNKDLESDIYTSTDVVGKSGIEKSMEEYLRGEKGTELLTINDSNKILSTSVKKEPVAGYNIYLSIDREQQIAYYHILERNLAAILISKLNNGFDYGSKGTRASGILIPIYEVYNALLSNNVIDITHFKKPDATALERTIYSYFEERRDLILNQLNRLMAPDSTTVNSAAGEEMEEYLDYVYQAMKRDEVGLVIDSAVNKTDPVYLDYVNNRTSLSQYLQYAITQNWIDLSVLETGSEFFTPEEYYEKMLERTFDYLLDDKGFEKKIYRTLVFSKKLTGTQICLLLFEQGVLEYKEEDYNRLKNGSQSAYNFIKEKISNLEITPGQLALEPYSGSIVANDPMTGKVEALVTYPSYDNNRLANKIDWDYYSGLLDDAAHPLINRPANQQTPAGSTFKPLTAMIGFGENLITTTSQIKDLGIFTLVDDGAPPKCWKYPGSHGSINISQALMHSCNYFFYDVAYRMSLENGKYLDSRGISKIREYAELFGLNDTSGIEIAESDPTISNRDAIRSMIGYYHNFSPVQIARYISTVVSKGTCYDFTLIDKITDKDGTVIYQQEPKIHNQITQFSEEQWNAVQKGMNWVVNTSANSLNRLYGDLGVTVAGKTGTPQVSLTRPSHALFTSFAPYENPELCVTIVIPNGYASANAAYIGREVYGFYFNGENKEDLLSGNVKAGTATTIRVSD